MFLEAQSSRVPWPPSGLPSVFSTPKNIPKSTGRSVRRRLNSRNHRRRNTAAISIIGASLRIPPLSTCETLPLESETPLRKRNTCCSLIRLAVAGQTNSHVVPVGQDGGRDSRPAGCALRSDTGGGGGGEGADPSGGTHPGGTRKRAEHGGGTVSAIYDGIERGSGVFDHRRGMGRSSGEITFLEKQIRDTAGHT